MKRKWILIVGMLLVLTGCSRRDQVDLQSYLADLKAKIVQKNKENLPPDIEFPVPVIYQSKTMRTPFQVVVSVTTNELTDQPLQSFPLNALRLLGTIQENNQMLAVIQTPDDIVYQVKIGDIIGKQYGKIIKILPDKVEIMEKSPDDVSTPAKYRIVSLQLRDEN